MQVEGSLSKQVDRLTSEVNELKRQVKMLTCNHDWSASYGGCVYCHKCNKERD